jgi:hypothetical protein
MKELNRLKMIKTDKIKEAEKTDKIKEAEKTDKIKEAEKTDKIKEEEVKKKATTREKTAILEAEKEVKESHQYHPETLYGIQITTLTVE